GDGERGRNLRGADNGHGAYGDSRVVGRDGRPRDEVGAGEGDRRSSAPDAGCRSDGAQRWRGRIDREDGRGAGPAARGHGDVCPAKCSVGGNGERGRNSRSTDNGQGIDGDAGVVGGDGGSEEHTAVLQPLPNLVSRLVLEE